MSYRLDLVNRAGLFTYYANWFQDDNQLDDSHNNIVYRITSLILSFEKNYELALECIEQFNLFAYSTNIHQSTKNINLATPSLYEIFINISNIFSSMRIIQNSIINIIAKQESKLGNKISLPNSMNDFVKKLDSFNVDQDLKNIIKKYWDENGINIKHYRDIDEHHNFLIKKVYVNNFIDKKLLILLPDNPNVQSYKKYTFKQQINALEFLKSEFDAIEKLLNTISQYYGYQQGEFHFTFVVDDSNPNNMTILYDLNNNKLTTLESFIHNNKINTFRTIADEDADKFKFLKNTTYFKNIKSFIQILKIENPEGTP